MNNFETVHAQRRQKAEAALLQFLPKDTALARTVAEAMEYAVSGGGKRLRPCMMMEFYSLCGKNEDDILPFACALEMIHCYSLVHDDLPCMDNSPLRRGKPSVWNKYGEWQAVLAGDGLLNYAFETVLYNTDDTRISPKTTLICLAQLANAAGIYGMLGGQTCDLESENRVITTEELEWLQQHKTGALLKAAGRIGMLAANAGPAARELADEYCDSLGLAFQISDDILDVCGSQEILGKPVGADNENNKVTFVTQLGLEGAKKRAEELTRQAIRTAHLLGSDYLATLAEEMLNRKG
ncbi:MAG: polyprenyl synthetase family protein [Clostridia bacterium]|nr:polyprenyl synthetase family protein [Clostridia bacterium]